MCLAATLIGIRVAVGGGKSLVFTIQIRIPQECGVENTTWNRERAQQQRNVCGGYDA